MEADLPIADLPAVVQADLRTIIVHVLQDQVVLQAANRHQVDQVQEDAKGKQIAL